MSSAASQRPAGILISGYDGGTCYGDSGGPLMVEGTNDLLGVVSHGTKGECEGAGDLTVYAPLYYRRSFLDLFLGPCDPGRRFTDWFSCSAATCQLDGTWAVEALDPTACTGDCTGDEVCHCGLCGYQRCIDGVWGDCQPYSAACPADELCTFDLMCAPAPAPSDSCSEFHGDLAACDDPAPDCAYYLCASECHPTGTPLEQVCP